MEKIKNPEDEDFSKWGGCDLTVLVDYQNGEESKRELFIPEWRDAGFDDIISLKIIEEQVMERYGDAIIVVIAEYPLNGDIYRFGNNMDGEWMRVGTIDGLSLIHI